MGEKKKGGRSSTRRSAKCMYFWWFTESHTRATPFPQVLSTIVKHPYRSVEHQKSHPRNSVALIAFCPRATCVRSGDISKAHPCSFVAPSALCPRTVGVWVMVHRKAHPCNPVALSALCSRTMHTYSDGAPKGSPLQARCPECLVPRRYVYIR